MCSQKYGEMQTSSCAELELLLSRDDGAESIVGHATVAAFGALEAGQETGADVVLTSAAELRDLLHDASFDHILCIQDSRSAAPGVLPEGSFSSQLAHGLRWLSNSRLQPSKNNRPQDDQSAHSCQYLKYSSKV